MTDISILGGQLKEALAHLYDPIWLRSSPLLSVFGLQNEANPSQALRAVLEEAIEELRPVGAGNPDSRGWRNYHILYGRYVQQFTQVDIAKQLGISTRHLRRQQDEAIETLALNLQARFRLAERLSSAETSVADEHAEVKGQTMRREMGWLSNSLADEVAHLPTALAEAHALAQTLAYRHEVALDVPMLKQEDLEVAVPQTVLKEAVLAVLATAIKAVPRGRIRIRVAPAKDAVSLQIVGMPHGGQIVDFAHLDGVTTAGELLSVFGAKLEVAPKPGALSVDMTLPFIRVRQVLVIEDNLDTLQLWKRYVQGTRFRLIGVSDPQEALPKAIAVRPDVIVLDLMMPGIDGWELLGRLRNHPHTCTIPIIVCTVLPQEELALSLGASAFMRKPITRQAFRRELARQIGDAEPASPPEW